MRSHLKRIARQKVSDFLLREEGMVGNRSAFATAALVSTTALAMALLVSPNTEAHLCPSNCGPHEVCVYCDPGKKCCTRGEWPHQWWFCVDSNKNC